MKKTSIAFRSDISLLSQIVFYRKLTVFMVVASVTLLLICCKKSGSSSTPTGDCQTNNYGILKVNYTDAAHGHFFTVQELDNNNNNVGPIYKKIDSAGILSDTMHLRPLSSGHNWYLNYESFYSNGNPYISTAAEITTLKQCIETDLNITF